MILQACAELIATLLPGRPFARARPPARLDDGRGLFSGLAEEFHASCLVDREAGVVVCGKGARRFEADEATVLGTGVLAAGVRLAETVAQDEIVDMVITTRSGIEVLRPLDASAALFVRVRMDRTRTSLVAARAFAARAEVAFV